MTNFWEPGQAYRSGDVVQYEGHQYRIIQPHTAQSDWAPNLTPALWGRLQDGDNNHGGQQHQQHGQQQQQQHNQGGQQQQQQQHTPDVKQDSWTQPAQQGQHTEVTHDEKKKEWYDLDDKRKKELQIGGGLLAGVAALGAGYFAFKEHEKSDEEKKAQTWALQNWLEDSKRRTDSYRQNGLPGPAVWVLNEGKNIPHNAIKTGDDPKHGWNMYPCRAFYDGGIQLGKASDVFKKGAVIGYKKEEIHFATYEILVGDMNGLRWVDVNGRINLSQLGARPVEGGKENDGTPLFVVQAYYKGATHPGKTSEKFDCAYIPYDDSEKEVKQYRVLCYAG